MEPMTSYATYQPSLYPTALADPYGQSWGRAQGVMKDRLATLAADAVDMGLVLRAPADALPYLADDAGGLERFPIDDDASHRARIASAWTLWPWAGTRYALEVVFGLLNPSPGTTRIATARELNRAPWAQWWAFVSQASPVALRNWDASSTWGSGVWGSLAARTFVATVRRFARRFANARDIGWAVTLRSSPGVWGTPGTWGAPSTWGGRNPRWRI